MQTPSLPKPIDPSPLFEVLRLVSPLHHCSVLCCVSHASLTLSSLIPQCKYMQYRGNRKFPSHRSGTSRKPQLGCSLVKQQRDCPLTQFALFQNCSSILFVTC
ncbi:hypothetical protein FQA47_008983 [Oryzias melastigma]|uniref:Uncharacterized protein n=1 Tax=Oryzias melastigma TaxID=30732 RepID=A0A834BNJ2_ORYME|nr:hypothetical protein FQA47_008983 [Oryzias melastigma]